jgi:glutamate synthase domain-containing protein 3
MTSKLVLFAAVAASTLVTSKAARAQGSVNVQITLRGDVGQYAGMCAASGGEDKLNGSLQLVSFDNDDGTALYQGTLERKTGVR